MCPYRLTDMPIGDSQHISYLLAALKEVRDYKQDRSFEDPSL